MKKGRKISLIVLSVIVTIIIAVISGGYYYINNMLSKIEKVEVNKENLGIDEKLDTELSTKYDSIQNIALFGIDNVDGLTGRSDSIMILTIDREHRTAKVTSIMRDSYVDISGRKNKDKINHAYAFGGPELALKTINENFGLNIKDFITVNFSSLPKIVDLIGGINLDIDESELKYINRCIKGLNVVNKTNASEITTTGIQHVNGTQALAYCRIRYTAGGDYKRTERHREVLGKIFEQLQKVSPSKYQELIDNVLPMTKTSLPKGDILTIGTDLVKIGGKLQEQRFPNDTDCEGKLIKGIYYLTFNEDITREKMNKWIFEDKKQ